MVPVEAQEGHEMLEVHLSRRPFEAQVGEERLELHPARRKMKRKALKIGREIKQTQPSMKYHM